MKTKISLLGFVLTFSVPAGASLYTSGTLSGGIIPDNNTIGLTETVVVSGQDPSISDVTLTFTLQGGEASDLSGYLRLGNTIGSSYYSLTSLIQSESGTLNGGSATAYSIDFGGGSMFAGQNPNDTWTLFLSDTAAGDVTTLNGWSLSVTAVPEPANMALEIFAAFVILITARKYFRKDGKCILSFEK